jgi:hypothetical protein
MPIITPQARGTVAAQTADSYVAPHKTILANTKAASIMAPYSDPSPQAPVEAVPATPAESGQPSTVEDIKSKEVTLSPQLTALARREQKFRQQEQAFKAEKAKVEAEKSELAELRDLKTKLAAKDYSALEQAGMTYEDYVQYKLNQGEEATPENKAIKKLETEVSNLRTAQEEAETKQYEATVNQYRRDIKSLVAKDPRFESIKETGADEHVLTHIIDTFEQDGEVLTVEDAAAEVEEAILEEAMRMSGLKKVQARLKPVEEKKVLPPPQKPGIRTLTQQMAPTQQTAYKPSQHLSPRERLAQAIAKAQKQT